MLSPGPGGAPPLPEELSLESKGTFHSSREAGPAPGERCRGSISLKDQGMQRVRRGDLRLEILIPPLVPLGTDQCGPQVSIVEFLLRVNHASVFT